MHKLSVAMTALYLCSLITTGSASSRLEKARNLFKIESGHNLREKPILGYKRPFYKHKDARDKLALFILLKKMLKFSVS